ncbi:MAG: UDP-N-acetylmuramoyl-L-alanyl-D-glutamate--2,6-diaminopimelate ligase [Anaerolineae bacterium]|nr:UDP-N-acetylmuramoyl-L-alanyl-D-glutamate--2,6-diaminopimelate ligase [Anaerolineae bacterium]
MRLATLLAPLPSYELHGSAEVEIGHITSDSRQVGPGALFVAVPGISVDGHHYIPDAVSRGAAAIVTERAVALPSSIPLVVTPNSREALAYLSASWHGYPARSLRVIGVTGTDGKTTTANLIRSILETAGHRTGLISTVNAVIGDTVLDTGLHTTTPDAPDVQRYLAEMVRTGTEYAVLESTSHGLAQGRVTACEFDVAVVTNVTHEHLDFHGSHEAYVAAKARLFRFLSESERKLGVPKVAILNADDAHYPLLRAIPADRHLAYGLDAPGDVTASAVCTLPHGLSFQAHTPVGDFAVQSPLVGRFNVYNCLAAIAVGASQGISLAAMQEGIARLAAVSGRMERIDEGQDFVAIVDFAHTPYALEQALRAARGLAAPGGRVIAVFGSAGLRDKQKRAWMGRVAAGQADLTVLTAEDPRTESLDGIMEQMAEGCRAGGGVEGRTFWRIGDRAEAIAFAVGMARAGDVVMACGKGHERSLCFGTTEYPWNEQEVMRESLRRLPERRR